jgi:hypothetical protein
MTHDNGHARPLPGVRGGASDDARAASRCISGRRDPPRVLELRPRCGDAMLRDGSGSSSLSCRSPHASLGVRVACRVRLHSDRVCRQACWPPEPAAAAAVSNQNDALQQAKHADLPALTVSDGAVVSEAPPPMGTGNSVEITDTARIRRLVFWSRRRRRPVRGRKR